MSVQILLIAAVVSTVAPVEMRATPQGPIEFAVEQHRRERVAQAKRDTGVPGGLPGRSESSEEAKPSARRKAMEPRKPAAQTRDSKNKDKAREGAKKDPQ
jgi:hypothetical protein